MGLGSPIKGQVNRKKSPFSFRSWKLPCFDANADLASNPFFNRMIQNGPTRLRTGQPFCSVTHPDQGATQPDPIVVWTPLSACAESRKTSVPCPVQIEFDSTCGFPACAGYQPLVTPDPGKMVTNNQRLVETKGCGNSQSALYGLANPNAGSLPQPEIIQISFSHRSPPGPA